MASYVKFMKKILENKKKLSEFETIALTEECSAILQKKRPPKPKDLGSFNIPCSIGNTSSGKARDLGENINFMPLSIFRNLGLREARHATMTLQLVDKSLKHPRGIIENVLVKIYLPSEFHYPRHEGRQRNPNYNWTTILGHLESSY